MNDNDNTDAMLVLVSLFLPKPRFCGLVVSEHCQGQNGLAQTRVPWFPPQLLPTFPFHLLLCRCYHWMQHCLPGASLAWHAPQQQAPAWEGTLKTLRTPSTHCFQEESRELVAPSASTRLCARCRSTAFCSNSSEKACCLVPYVQRSPPEPPLHASMLSMQHCCRLEGAGRRPCCWCTCRPDSASSPATVQGQRARRHRRPLPCYVHFANVGSPSKATLIMWKASGLQLIDFLGKSYQCMTSCEARQVSFASLQSSPGWTGTHPWRMQ
jgi:hypothetical protein